LTRGLARLTLDLGFAIILYVALAMIVVPAYLLIAKRGASRRLRDSMPRRNEKVKKRAKKPSPPVGSAEPIPRTVEPSPPVGSAEPIPRTVEPSPPVGSAEPIPRTVEPSPPVGSAEPIPRTVEPSPPAHSNVRLDGVAKSIGMDVKSLQRWVDEQKRMAAGEDRVQAMSKILADLEKSAETRDRKPSLEN
jgi:hypothetical protein